MVAAGAAGVHPAAALASSRRGADRPAVVASVFPLAEAARRVGGPHVRVADLTPPGVEPHDLELTTDDVDAILDADLAIVMGDGFQPAVEASADDRDRPTLVVLDAVSRHTHRNDPHVWLDPVRYRAIVDAVARALARVDPARADVYRADAARYGADLAALDADFVRGLAHCATRTIVTAHEAFGWLAARYHLRQLGVAGVDPEAEPNPERVAQLADTARRTHSTTIFTEPLVSRRVARTIAREAGNLHTAVLDPLEGLSDARRAAGDDYLTVMRRNLRALHRALGCT